MVGRGRLSGNKAGAGPGGYCKCPKCKKLFKHRTGEACYTRKCPKCKVSLVRA